MPGVYQGVRMRGCLERTRALVPGKTQGVRESQRECLGRPRAFVLGKDQGVCVCWWYPGHSY